MEETDGRARRLSVSVVSEASGYSSQQVRDLEALGVIAPAPRANNGYRRFSPAHIRELDTYRNVATAVGPVEARRVMCKIRALTPQEGAALVGSLHSRLNQQRQQALLARDALQAIGAEVEIEVAPTSHDAMRITELADALDVRTSKLRFWQKEGLVEPDRVLTNSGTARQYPVHAIREARITAALRSAGYRIPEVREAIDAVRNLDDVGRSLDALATRIEVIGQRAVALLRAGTGLADIIASAPDVAEHDMV